MVAVEFARFLGLPIANRANITDIMTFAPRTLPVVIPPVTYETVDSYLKRLATANYIATEDIETAVGASRSNYTSSRSRTLDVGKLAAVTGQPLRQLIQALPGLQQPGLTLKRFQARSRAACPHCVRRHAVQPIIQFYPHHVNACARHNLWLGSLGPASRAWPSEYDLVDISDVPEIKRAGGPTPTPGQTPRPIPCSRRRLCCF